MKTKPDQYEVLSEALRFYHERRKAVDGIEKAKHGSEEWRALHGKVEANLAYFILMKHSYIYNGFDISVWDKTFEEEVARITPTNIVFTQFFFSR